MLLKILLKIWPALIPITVYLLWVYVIEKLVIQRLLKRRSKEEKIIEGEFQTVGEKSTKEEVGKGEGDTKNIFARSSKAFSLQNPNFVLVLYLSLIFSIIALILSAFK